MSEWRVVDGWSAYEVSSTGTVRRAVGGQGAKAGKVLTWHMGSNGYPNVRLCADGKQATLNVHVLVARAFLGPRPDGLQARHLDGVKMNCAASNLVYGTHKDNQEDKVRHGTSSRGVKNPRAKINPAIAETIRLDYGFGFSARELAAAHCLSESTVYRIVNGTYWQEASNRAMDRGTA